MWKASFLCSKKHRLSASNGQRLRGDLTRDNRIMMQGRRQLWVVASLCQRPRHQFNQTPRLECSPMHRSEQRNVAQSQAGLPLSGRVPTEGK